MRKPRASSISAIATDRSDQSHSVSAPIPAFRCRLCAVAQYPRCYRVHVVCADAFFRFGVSRDEKTTVCTLRDASSSPSSRTRLSHSGWAPKERSSGRWEQLLLSPLLALSWSAFALYINRLEKRRTSLGRYHRMDVDSLRAYKKASIPTRLEQDSGIIRIVYLALRSLEDLIVHTLPLSCWPNPTYLSSDMVGVNRVGAPMTSV